MEEKSYTIEYENDSQCEENTDYIINEDELIQDIDNSQ